MTERDPNELKRANRTLLVKLGVVAAIMFGFGFLLVPFYEQICKATGLRDIDRPDKVQNTQVDAARSVRLELDANVNKLPWRFHPLTPIVTVHPGELAQVVYEVENTSERPMPVVFVIDPKLPKDVNTITLSYTFFEVEGNRS